MAFTTTGAQSGYTAGVELKPSVLDAIVLQGAVDVPLMKAIGRGNYANPITHSWITDRYRGAKKNAKMEISTPAGDTKSTKQKSSNFTQIFTDDIEVSKSKAKASQYGAKEMEYQTGKTSKEHAIDLEYSLLGLHRTTVFTDGVQRTEAVAGEMAGIFHYIPTANRVEKAAMDAVMGNRVPLTWDIFCEILQKAWEQGAEVNKVFVGAHLKGTINSLAKDFLIHETGTKTFDPRITKVATDFGVVDVHLHRMFNETNKLASTILAGDFSYAKWMSYIDTHIEDVPTNKTAKVKRIYTEGTLEVRNNDMFACGYGLK